jgi:hypothetical protein
VFSSIGNLLEDSKQQGVISEDYSEVYSASIIRNARLNLLVTYTGDNTGSFYLTQECLDASTCATSEAAGEVFGCPIGLFRDTATLTCETCDSNCKDCTGTSTSCIDCEYTHIWDGTS